MESIPGLVVFVNENYGSKYNAFEIADMFEVGVAEVKAIARELKIGKDGLRTLSEQSRATYVSPEDIEKRKKEVQAKWSEADWMRRAGYKKRQHVEIKEVKSPIENVEDLL
jgi:hypothetical protein